MQRAPCPHRHPINSRLHTSRVGIRRESAQGHCHPQGFARTLDRRARMEPLRPIRHAELKDARLNAMVEVACDLMQEGSPAPNGITLHRLQKADTAGGLDTIKSLAAMGAPY